MEFIFIIMLLKVNDAFTQRCVYVLLLSFIAIYIGCLCITAIIN